MTRVIPFQTHFSHSSASRGGHLDQSLTQVIRRFRGLTHLKFPFRALFWRGCRFQGDKCWRSSASSSSSNSSFAGCFCSQVPNSATRKVSPLPDPNSGHPTSALLSNVDGDISRSLIRKFRARWPLCQFEVRAI